MPLHGKDPFELYKTRVKPGEEYFVIKFTKEHFKRYKDYIDRYELYRQRIWTCSITGKTNLTFEEALLSEKISSEKVSKVSELLLPHCLEFIQYKEITLEEITNQLYEFLLMNFYPGEIVVFKKGSNKYTGRIIELLENYNENDQENSDIDNDKSKKSSSSSSSSSSVATSATTTSSATTTTTTSPTMKTTSTTSINAPLIPIPKKDSKLYSDDEDDEKVEQQQQEEEEEEEEEEEKVKSKEQVKNKDESSSSSSTKTNRKYADPRKKLDSMKKYYKIYVDSQSKNFVANIKDIVRRDPPIFKPMVKDTIKTVAKKTKHLGGYWEVDSELIKKYNLENLKVPSSIRKEVEQHKKKKRSLGDDGSGENGTAEEGEDTNGDVDIDGINYESSDESEVERKRKRPKYPMEDLEIERGEGGDDENNHEIIERPIASTDFFCTSTTFGEFLMVWHFINHFEKVLLLTPFSLEDFENAIDYHTETKILVETHIRLMKTIFTLPSYSSGTPKKLFGGKAITDRNWIATLKAFFQNEVKRIAIQEKVKQEKLKLLEEQNTRMLNLANELPNSDDEQDQDQIDENGSKDKINVDGEENDGDIKMKDRGTDDEGEEGEEEEEEIASDDGEAEWEEEETITSADANLISKILKKKNYFKLSVNERIYILAYLVKQVIASDKIRKHLDKIIEVSNEIKQEKKDIILEEKQLKEKAASKTNSNSDNEENEDEDEVEEDEEEESEEEVVQKNNRNSKTNSSNNNNNNKKITNQSIDKLEKQKESLDHKLEKYSTRLESLGKDRNFRNYWYWYQLPDRIYIENENGGWEYYSTKKELDDLLKYLDNRGIRERKLLNAIKPKYDFICIQLEKKNKELIEQIRFESRRSQRIKTLYQEKSFLSYENQYEY